MVEQVPIQADGFGEHCLGAVLGWLWGRQGHLGRASSVSLFSCGHTLSCVPLANAISCTCSKLRGMRREKRSGAAVSCFSPPCQVRTKYRGPQESALGQPPLDGCHRHLSLFSFLIWGQLVRNRCRRESHSAAQLPFLLCAPSLKPDPDSTRGLHF